MFLRRVKNIGNDTQGQAKARSDHHRGKNVDAVGIEPTTFHKLHLMMRSENLFNY
jgi:hypothetical protein